jgi:hypothetical protein
MAELDHKGPTPLERENPTLRGRAGGQRWGHPNA